MLVNERVLITYPSDLFSVEFSSGISTVIAVLENLLFCNNVRNLPIKAHDATL